MCKDNNYKMNHQYEEIRNYMVNFVKTIDVS